MTQKAKVLICVRVVLLFHVAWLKLFFTASTFLVSSPPLVLATILHNLKTTHKEGAQFYRTRTVEKSHATEITSPSSRDSVFKEMACKRKSENRPLNCLLEQFLHWQSLPCDLGSCSFSGNSQSCLLAGVVHGHWFFLSIAEKRSWAILL